MPGFKHELQQSGQHNFCFNYWWWVSSTKHQRDLMSLCTLQLKNYIYLLNYCIIFYTYI